MHASTTDGINLSIDATKIDTKKTKEAAWRLQNYLNQKWYTSLGERYLLPIVACFGIFGTAFTVLSEFLLSIWIDNYEIRRLILGVAVIATMSFYIGYLIGDRRKVKYIAFIELISSLITAKGLESSFALQGKSLDVEICGNKHAFCPIDLLLIKYAIELDDTIPKENNF
jgi:hypothetical protein